MNSRISEQKTWSLVIQQSIKRIVFIVNFMKFVFSGSTVERFLVTPLHIVSEYAFGGQGQSALHDLLIGMDLLRLLGQKRY